MAGENVLNRFEQADSSGDNKLVLDGTVETGSAQNLKSIFVTGVIPDIGTAETIFVGGSVTGTIIKMTLVISASLNANTVVTLSIGNALIDQGSITVNNGLGAGAVITRIPVTDNVIESETDTLKIITDGNTSTVTQASVIFEIVPD